LTTTIERPNSPRMKATWPITIITNRCPIKGESRNITSNGIFACFEEQLYENRTYRMIITLPQKGYIAVRGKVIWSNLNGIDPNGTFSEMGFCFVELPEEERFLLNHAVSAQLA
jgi:hypothetical protein